MQVVDKLRRLIANVFPEAEQSLEADERPACAFGTAGRPDGTAGPHAWPGDVVGTFKKSLHDYEPGPDEEDLIWD